MFHIIENDDETWLYQDLEPIAEFHSMRDIAQKVADACNHYERYKAALQTIEKIPNKTSGGDWDEIEEARAIARNALE